MSGCIACKESASGVCTLHNGSAARAAASPVEPTPGLREATPERFQCGNCGDWLELQWIVGHLLSEGRDPAALAASPAPEPTGRAIAEAVRRVSNREAFKYVNIDWTALGAALVQEFPAPEPTGLPMDRGAASVFDDLRAEEDALALAALQEAIRTAAMLRTESVTIQAPLARALAARLKEPTE